MSAVGGGELAEVLLRSSTPAANEKVLNFLQNLPEDHRAMSPHSRPPSEIASQLTNTRPTKKPSDWDPTSPKITGSPKLFAPSPKNGSVNHGLDELAGSLVSYGGVNGAKQQRDDDLDSNVQEGMRSELGGETVPIHTTGMHEPGPNDPPGPRYESYGSSFGNMGPLPRDSAQPPNWTTWTPQWQQNIQSTPARAAVVPLPDGSLAAPQTMGGITPGAAKIALPESVASPSEFRFGINVESPTSAGDMKDLQKMSLSRASHRSSGAKEDELASVGKGDVPTSPTSRSRSGSKGKAGDDLKSQMSRATHKTRVSEKGTEYPPLPMSVQGETNIWSPTSQTSKLPKSHSRAPSKPPSVSPSDSPSQARYKSPTRSPGPKLKSIPSEDGAGAESPKRGNGNPPASAVLSHQSRPFSPYRHAATTGDMFAIAAERITSPTKSSHKAPSVHSRSQNNSKRSVVDGDKTPTPSRAQSPQSPSIDLDQNEAQLVKDTIASRRTSYAAPPSNLEPEIANSHFHDMDLCILLHQMDDYNTHEVVKKALRKAVRQRVKKLGMKYDSESIKQYRKSFHDHDPEVHMQPGYQPTFPAEIPDWAKMLVNGMNLVHERFDGLDDKLSRLKPEARGYIDDQSHFAEGDQYEQTTPRTQTVNINTQPTGHTMGESMFPIEETEVMQGHMPEQEGDYDEHDEADYNRGLPTNQTGDTRTHGPMSDLMSEGRDDSPGQQYLEEELYKLRIKPGGSQSATHKTWELGEVPQDEQDEYDDEHHDNLTDSGIPEIPDSGNYTDRRAASPPLPPIPHDDQSDVVTSPQAQNKMLVGNYYGDQEAYIPPWQRVHQRLLSWAIVWPMSEIEHALNSTTRGQQVDEIALSIWSVQSYKRYVRSKMTDSPGGRPDRLFVPPNMADAISTAVFNGRHGDACGMLKDLWGPFGLEGAPRLIIVLAKHRSDANHWVVHRFSLSEGALTTYDSYPERTLPDGRPLGWWFAIRVAWPGAVTQSPDHLLQKMVRLHRPMQLGIDNSVAAAGIWRNILMGSRAERSLDLERLRDLINTEVRNLRQRKIQGKLSLSNTPKPNWEDMN